MQDCLLILGTALFPNQSFAQTQATLPPPSALKKLSVEELMNIEVTSVSRRPEKLSETASAIQVVTGEDIRRSGASSIPEALRLADNLQVAQKGSQGWGISARGSTLILPTNFWSCGWADCLYPLYSGVFWDVQDYLLEDIDRIEVISGPGGTLWGRMPSTASSTSSARARRILRDFIWRAGRFGVAGFGGARYGGTLASNVYYRVYGKYFDRDSAVLANGNDAGDS